MSQIPDFEALFRVSPYPYLLMDRRLIIVGAYSAYLKSTGRVEADLLGRYVFDAFPENPDDPSSTWRCAERGANSALVTSAVM